MAPSSKSQLIIVANRLPVRRSSNRKNWEMSPGGLVSALFPYLERTRGRWVGWAGSAGSPPKSFKYHGISQDPVGVSAAELDDFYYGFCNATIWPLYHDAVRTPEFHRHWWRPYQKINQRFADVAVKGMASDDHVWVQDYQLQLVPQMIRKKKSKAKIGFFLHIPFPPVELFSQIPWRKQILEGLLGSDVIGFQTKLSAQNFLRSVRQILGLKSADNRVEVDGREVLIRDYPISIDVDRYESTAKKDAVIEKAERLKKRIGKDRKIIFGVDRLDYTKGVDKRIKTIETLLEQKRMKIEDFVYLQVLVPSREKIPLYLEMRGQIEGQVGHINGEFGTPGLIPVHYMHRSLPFEELISYYLASDVMFVTPLADGMNLVCKEYVACKPDDSGVLVLSEFAGAARFFKEAIQVNPHDVDGMANALEKALKLPSSESQKRMKALRRRLKKNDVYRWAEGFLGDLTN